MLNADLFAVPTARGGAQRPASTAARSLRDIICISTHYWDDAWFRKQQFMSRLVHRGHRVLYVQPSYSMVRRPYWPGLARNRWLRSRLERRSDRLFLFSPPRLVPKHTHPWLSELNYRWFGWLIAREAERLGFRDPCLWIYPPEYAAALEQIPHSHLVFDLVDDLEAYHDTAAGARAAKRRITQLLERADLTVVTSPTLADDVAARTRACVLIGNGYDEQLFDHRPRPTPPELAALRRPIAGFVGALFGFIDYELLYRTIATLPEVSFVFVGRTFNEGRSGVERLRGLPNATFLGAKPQAEVPAYVSGFDVCIAPFKTDGVSRAVSPLKIYEYLACGKPVVSTPLEGVSREEAGRWVRFAASADFPATVAEVLAASRPAAVDAARAQAAKAFSWSRQFERLEPHLEPLLSI